MLAIDIGNSRVKWAFFEGEKILSHDAFSYDKKNFEKKLNDANWPALKTFIEVSCVAGEEIKARFVQWLMLNKCSKYSFAQTQKYQNGVTNSYEIPSSMGVDRWLAMLAAYKLYNANPTELICVIDCGTAITIDMLTANGEHVGGLIMPGYQTMMQSLVEGAGNIQIAQSMKIKQASKLELASATQPAIVQGCSHLMLEGMIGIVFRYLKRGVRLHCIITGGDGDWIASELSQRLEANECTSEYRPFLVLQGLRFYHDKN